jgi:hypothetical protein
MVRARRTAGIAGLAVAALARPAMKQFAGR